MDMFPRRTFELHKANISALLTASSGSVVGAYSSKAPDYILYPEKESQIPGLEKMSLANINLLFDKNCAQKRDGKEKENQVKIAGNNLEY